MLRLLRGQDEQWRTIVQGVAVTAAAVPGMLVVACADGTLHGFHASGRRAHPAIGASVRAATFLPAT